MEEARAWRWHNQDHKHSGLKFVAPVQRHNGQATAIMAQREQVYREAKSRNLRRWTRQTRNWKLETGNWKLEEEVWPNPERIRSEELKQAA